MAVRVPVVLAVAEMVREAVAVAVATAGVAEAEWVGDALPEQGEAEGGADSLALRLGVCDGVKDADVTPLHTVEGVFSSSPCPVNDAAYTAPDTSPDANASAA